MNETKNVALLVMDVQAGTVSRLANNEDYVKKVSSAVAFAHKKQIPVIFVVVGFRPGFPEISDNNKSFSAFKGNLAATMTNPVPYIEPVDTDIVVTKRRVSAFSGSDLEVILRARGITHIVLAGISTSGVVLSTTREAADKDYQITILSDLCADFDEEVHNVLITKLFPRQAVVMGSGEWTTSIESGS